VREGTASRPTAAEAAAAAESGDLRAFDTMQEQFSLADRFGLTVIFTTPSQEEYLYIAEQIAEKRGILSGSGDRAEQDASGARQVFRENALRWERWFNGRSPRTAVQYVDWLAGTDGGSVRHGDPGGPEKNTGGRKEIQDRSARRLKFPWEPAALL
jgi:predicted AAA+ superfamily ATPase